MKCSLIITTYNWEVALEIVILSVLGQSILPNEIIVADDGSDDKTKKIIQKLQNQTDIPIIHSWQKDNGFRLAKCRNKAISETSHDYIIMVDGDMILHKHFIKNHLIHASLGFFIQGPRVLLLEGITKQIFKTRNVNINFFTKNVINRKNTINSNFLANIFSKHNTRLRGVKACNMSFWRCDAIKINGFNEEFIGWGREDSEFVVRLFNNGIKRQNIKFNCNAFHLYHPENERIRLVKNDEILKNTIDKKLKFCQRGINQYL